MQALCKGSKMNYLNKFFIGRWDNNDLTAFKWWNSKRAEYTIRFLGCLLAGQLLIALASFSLGLTNSENISSRLISLLVGDLILIVFINLLYFLWPAIEAIFFRKSPDGYRKKCFIFLNITNILVFTVFLLLTISVKL
jgi:hypothetical protein